MSSFTKPLIVEKLGDNKWKLHTAFEYHVGKEGSDEVVRVPEGFVTDFASIPRAFWSILHPTGRYAAAAVIHDFLYANHIYTRKRSDQIFLEGMKVLGVNWLTRGIMYRAVRWFGAKAWKK